MVLIWTQGLYMDSWYIWGFKVLPFTDGIILVLLNHTHTRGSSVVHCQPWILGGMFDILGHYQGGGREGCNLVAKLTP